MKRSFKIAGAVLAALLVVLVAVFYFVYSSLGSLIVASVESFGSDATQAEVELQDAEVSVTSGEGALRGLRVGNPAGFATESAFWLGRISLKLDVATVGADPVVVKEIVIQAPEVTYELGEAGSNIDALTRNVERYTKQRTGGDGKKGTADDAGGGGSGPKLVIENLYVRDGVVKVSATALGGKTLDAPLPTIHLKNIGKASGGATPDQVIAQLVSSLSRSVGTAVAPLGLETLKGAAGAGAAAAKGALEQGAGATDSLKKGAEGAGEQLKKLFGD